MMLLMFAVVCVLVTSAQGEAIAAVETGDANVDDPIESADLDGEFSRRRRMRQFRPNRRRGGYFPRWLFG